MCRLNVTIESPFLSQQIGQLEDELQAKHLRFRPHFWISNEWFTPDGVPSQSGVAHIACAACEKPASAARVARVIRIPVTARRHRVSERVAQLRDSSMRGCRRESTPLSSGESQD